MLAVIAALVLLALGSAAALRLVVPDSEVVKGSVISGPVAWARSLQQQIGEDEARAAGVPNYEVAQWAVRCGLATNVGEKVRAIDTPDNPTFDHLNYIGTRLYEDRVRLANGIGGTLTILVPGIRAE